MKKLDQKGFAAVEAVLIVVIIGILGFTGWFVWHAKQNTDKSLDAANNSEQAKIKAKKSDSKQTAQTTDETASWLLYSPPSKEYSVRLADGWKLERYQDSSSLYTFNNNDLVNHQGTKAVVTQVDGGKDGVTGFFLNYATQNLDQIYSPGDRQADLKTVDGMTVESYFYVEHNHTEGLGLQEGDSQYTYIIRKGSSVAVVVTYSRGLGVANHQDVIEKVVKTVHIN
jgi:hypothetical protein